MAFFSTGLDLHFEKNYFKQLGGLVRLPRKNRGMVQWDASLDQDFLWTLICDELDCIHGPCTDDRPWSDFEQWLFNFEDTLSGTKSLLNELLKDPLLKDQERLAVACVVFHQLF